MSLDVLLVGAGKMGGAMAARWRETDICRKLIVIDPTAGIASPNDIPSDFKPDVVIFAVKPQILADVTGHYTPYIQNGALCISIAAGKTLGFFERVFGKDARVVRAMPNLPASIGRGITVAVANKNVSAAEKDRATFLLAAVGEVSWVDDENLINPVTALSGSGPAYVFLLIETLAEAGIHAGLDPDIASTLARQTVIGSAALAHASPTVPASTLRDNVTSPGGTTAAALDVLMADNGLQNIFDRALAAATNRARELAD